ncbi:MFS transporter [Microbacterium lushaniae]|nr:MFS transporter [Microbacterium lushaniae]
MSVSRSSPQSGAGGRRAVTLLCVLLIFGAETLFAATLPLFGEVLGYADPVLIGLALSLSSGVGFLLLPFFVRAIDGGRMRSLMLMCASLMLLSCLLVMQSNELGVVALLVGSLVFGAARIVGVVGLLAMVARIPGSRTANQGWNGGLQRLGSMIALLVGGVLFASENWAGVFVMLMVMIALWWLFADRSAKMSDAQVTRKVRREQPGRWLLALACVAALRSRRVLAAAALTILILLVLMHGNAFFTMAFAGEIDATALSSLVVTTIVLRDGVAVVGGVLYPFVLQRIGSRGMLWALAVLAVLPMPLMILAPSAAVPGAFLAAVASGLMVGWGSATANLLAAGADSAGAGLRIAASQLPAGIFLLVAPFAFGGAVLELGIQAAYGMLLLVLAVGGSLMLRASRGADLAA